MIKITVAQTGVKNINGTSAKGKPYSMSFQTAYAHTVDRDGNPPPFPEKFEILLDKDQQPYSVGDYQLHPSSVYIDQNGRLAVSARLTPLSKKPATA
jgi:hypothetical protein